ncbi:MAG: TonB-dependent receptor, partial [Verrucomicrobiota bacterium]
REAFLSSDPSTGRRSRPGLLPNPDLGPETSNTWEAGIQHSVTGVFQGGDRLRFRAAFYDQTLEDGLVAVVSEVPNYNTTVNLEEHSLYGLEFEASYDSELFFYRLTYDRRVREELGDGLPGDPIQNQPWSVFSNLGFRLMDGRLTLGMEHRHVTDYSETSLEDTDDNANTIARLFRPSFDLFNLYAQYRVNDHLLVNARVDNAADELYQAYQTLDAGMGRNAKISAEFRW